MMLLFTFLKYEYKEVHERIIETKQTVTKQEAQVAPKVRNEVCCVIDVELLFYRELILGKVDS